MCVHAKLLQSCPTLCDHMDYRTPGSSVHGSSREEYVKVKVSQSSLTLQPHGLYMYSPWNSPGQSTEVGSLSLLQGIVPTQGLNPGLLHCRQILYQRSYKGSPKNTGVCCYFLIQGSLPNPGIEPTSLTSPALAGKS